MWYLIISLLSMFKYIVNNYAVVVVSGEASLKTGTEHNHKA
jgi:hypothetical protein